MSGQSQSSRAGKPRQYGYWRAASLMGVYLLFGLHIAHWKITGRTLAPLELNEVMYTLELGILTAGFLFMILAMVSVLIVGRFFCSWGCHILALEDLSAWLLEKIGIRPKPVRLRSLLLVPPGAMVYMFVWPQISRLLDGREMPALHITTDQAGWASFITQDFWRNLPGPGVIVFTFFVVGFLIVYLLGSRSFCRYVCPYGALFSLADRVAPGKIISLGDCSGCGICTAKCSSDIRVHEELTVFGKVVSPSCLKDMDCVSSCPEGNIAFGFTKPSFFKSWKSHEKIKQPRYDFTLLEEGLLVLLFLGFFFSIRGLYGIFPFMLSMALGAIFAFGAIKAIRLVYADHVRLNQFQLKINQRIRRAGWVFAAIVVVVGVLGMHSGYIRYHEFVGWRAVRALEQHPSDLDEPSDASAMVELAYAHLMTTKKWGVYTPSALDEKIGELRVARAQVQAQGGDGAGAIAELESVIQDYPDLAIGHYNLGGLYAMAGQEVKAIEQYEAALRLDPSDPETWNTLGYLLLKAGRMDHAEYSFLAAIERKADYAHPYFHLARLMAMQGRYSQAEIYIKQAAELDPANYGQFLTPSP